MSRLTNQDWDHLGEEIGFVAADSTTVFGEVDQFPVAITLLPTSGTNGILIQVRHALSAKEQRETQQEYLPRLANVLASGGGVLSFDDRIAWLRMTDLDLVSGVLSVKEVVDDLIAWLRAAGADDCSGTCEMCRSEIADVRYVDGRVIAICDLCLDQRRATVAPTQNINSSVDVLLRGALGILPSSGIWFGLWYAHDWLLDRLANGKRAVYLPHIAEIAALVIAAFLVSAPIGYLIRLAPNRGPTAGRVAGVMTLVAIIIGEAVSFVRWAASLRDSLSWFVMIWGYLVALDVPSILFRIALGIVSVVVAYEIAVKRRPPLVT